MVKLVYSSKNFGNESNLLIKKAFMVEIQIKTLKLLIGYAQIKVLFKKMKKNKENCD